jgi:hypothetical protein
MADGIGPADKAGRTYSAVIAGVRSGFAGDFKHDGALIMSIAESCGGHPQAKEIRRELGRMLQRSRFASSSRGQAQGPIRSRRGAGGLPGGGRSAIPLRLDYRAWSVQRLPVRLVTTPQTVHSFTAGTVRVSCRKWRW